MAVNAILMSLASLAAAFQLCGLLLTYLILEKRRLQLAGIHLANQYDIAVARLRDAQRRVHRRGRPWRKPGRTQQWWLNLYHGVLPESDWKKNFRMDREVFTKLADELAPYLRPGRSPRGLDVLSVEKQLALTLYFLKDQGSLMMTANTFGIAVSTVSVIVRKVCEAITQVLGPRYIKLPSNTREMAHLVKGMESKYGFPQGFGCIDGTHIEIMQPTENPHDYFSYKQKYTINVQAVCDWKGMFIDVEVKWPGSVHDGRVFGNSKINRLLREEKMPMMYKELLPGYDKIPVTLIGDPAYPLLPYCMKEFASPNNNEEVIFNNMLRSARNPIECAFGRLKARWQILSKRINLGLVLVPTLVYACFVLHNFCEQHGVSLEDEAVAQQLANARMQPDMPPDRLYSFNTAEGTSTRNTITMYYREHIPH